MLVFEKVIKLIFVSLVIGGVLGVGDRLCFILGEGRVGVFCCRDVKGRIIFFMF